MLIMLNYHMMGIVQYLKGYCRISAKRMKTGLRLLNCQILAAEGDTLRPQVSGDLNITRGAEHQGRISPHRTPVS